jgi:hypothetical protein
MLKRRRFKQAKPLSDRLANFIAEELRKVAEMPEGPARNAMLKKIKQAEIAANVEVWANSSGLRPRK